MPTAIVAYFLKFRSLTCARNLFTSYYDAAWKNIGKDV